MDAEDEGAPPAPSPPPPLSSSLQQHSIEDTEVVEGVEALVVGAEDTGLATEGTHIGDSANEGVTEMQVMEDKVSDVVVEKGDGSDQEAHENLEGTHVGELAQVEEEETRSAINQTEIAEKDEENGLELANEAASIEERAEEQEKEMKIELEEEVEEEKFKGKEIEHEEEDDSGRGVANEAVSVELHEKVLETEPDEGAELCGGTANEAVYMGEQEEGQGREEETVVGGNIANEGSFMEVLENRQEEETVVGGNIANEVAFMDVQEKRQEEEADDGGGIANEAASVEEQEEGQKQEVEKEEADVGVGTATEASFMEDEGQKPEEEEADDDTCIANEAAFMEEQEQEVEQAQAGDGIADASDLMEQHEEEHEDEQEGEEQADAAGAIADQAGLMEEHEEEQEVEEEEADGGGSVGMGEDAEGTEEIEELEEQSRSVSGGKRKRGGKSSKSPGKVPSKKKMEEDVCFICFDGGELVLCDKRSERINILFTPHIFVF